MWLFYAIMLHFYIKREIDLTKGCREQKKERRKKPHCAMQVLEFCVVIKQSTVTGALIGFSESAKSA